jgi:hypothetical protein
MMLTSYFRCCNFLLKGVEEAFCVFRLVAVSFPGLFLLSLSSVRAADSVGLTFAEKHLEAQVGLADRNVTVEFPFENKTKQPVQLVEIKPTCGCTEAVAELKPYAPGEKGVVRVTFNFGHRVGRQLQIVNVKTNPAPTETIVLLLGVTIPEPVKFEPKFVYWKLGEPVSTKRVTARVVPDAPFKVVRFESSNPVMGVEAKPREGEPGVYDLDITPKATDAELSATLSLVGETPQGEIVAYAAYGIVRKF